MVPVTPEPVAPPLVEQPTAAPTRKWTFSTIAQGIITVGGIAALFWGEIVSDTEAKEIATGLLTANLVIGRVVAYFTKNRAA